MKSSEQKRHQTELHNEKLSLKLDGCLKRLVAAEKQVGEENAINTRLVENHKMLLDQVQERDSIIAKQGEEVKELKEQVRDIMFFLEASQNKGIEGASVVGVSPAPSTSANTTTTSPTKKGSRKKK